MLGNDLLPTGHILMTWSIKIGKSLEKLVIDSSQWWPKEAIHYYLLPGIQIMPLVLPYFLNI